MKRVWVCGDIHGSFKPIRDFELRNKEKYTFSREIDAIIILGDAGLNFFFNHRDRKLKEKLEKYPFTYFIIRGNHEERPSLCAEKAPNEWHKEQFWENDVWVENNYPHIKYAMDNVSFYQIEADNAVYKTLVLPGAYSVDKYKRLSSGWSWFENEQLSEEEKEDGRKLLDKEHWRCDLVLSHTCPIIFEPTDLFLSVVDQATVDKSMERYLGEIEYKLDYEAWLWGHYHQFRDYPRTDGRKRLMLFNDALIQLNEYIENSNDSVVIKY